MKNAKLSVAYEDFSEKHKRLFDNLSLEVDKLQEKSKFDPKSLEYLNHSRLLTSSTFMKREELHHWDSANKRLYQLIGTPLTLNMIKELNLILTSHGGLRESEVYGSGLQYLKHKYLNQEISHFSDLLKKHHSYHFLNFAFRIYFWICSAHPFKNGNGRTARLVTDKILLENGCLPLCFPNSSTSHVAYFEELKESFNLEQKINNFSLGVKRSFQIIST